MNLKHDGLLFAKNNGESEVKRLKSMLSFDLIKELKSIIYEKRDSFYREVSIYSLTILLEKYEASQNKDVIRQDIDTIERQLQQINNELDNYRAGYK